MDLEEYFRELVLAVKGTQGEQLVMEFVGVARKPSSMSLSATSSPTRLSSAGPKPQVSEALTPKASEDALDQQ